MAQHKHAELIKKWADDTDIKIQFRHKKDAAWIDIIDYIPSWHVGYEYRIKPNNKRYKVALFKDGSTTTADNEYEENEYCDRCDFSRWLTKWVEVDI